MREEDIAFCRAWIRASENPLKGAQEKAEDFWKRVYECTLSASAVRFRRNWTALIPTKAAALTTNIIFCRCGPFLLANSLVRYPTAIGHG